MNSKKIFNLAMALVLAVSWMGSPGTVGAQEGNPRIGVIYNVEAVALWGWTAGAEVTLTIDNPLNGIGIDYSTSMVIDQADSVFNVGDTFDIHVGDTVTVTDGSITRKVVVTDVRILGVNPETDMVYGKADPLDILTIFAYWNCGFQSQVVTADQVGNWTANFSGSCNIIDSTIVSATEDGEGGVTRFDFAIPFVTVQIKKNIVNSFRWLSGNEVTLTIDDLATGEGVDYTDTKIAVPSGWDPNQSFVTFILGSFELHPGQVVRMSDGITTKSLTLANLTLDDGNVTNDTVWGKADPGSKVQVLLSSNYNVFRNVIADSSGAWSALFSEPGDEPGEENPYDIQRGDVVLINHNDEDGDQTQLWWYALNPNIEVTTSNQQIIGREWNLGSEITLSIDSAANGAGIDYTKKTTMGPSSWNQNDIVANFDLSGIFTFYPGDVITMTDGVKSMTYTVQALGLTEINIKDDTASGTGTAGDVLQVCVNAPSFCAFQRYVTVDGNGKWIADFSEPGVQPNEQDTVDILPGYNVRVIDQDQYGNRTCEFWNAPNPTFGVRFNEDLVEGWEWTLGTTVTIDIDDPTTADDPDPITATVGIADWDPNQTWFGADFKDMYDVKPGDVITVTDGTVTKQHTVENFHFTSVDVFTDVVNGVANPNQRVKVWTCDGMGCIHRNEAADESGNWSANFAVPGEEDREQETANLWYGSWVDSSVSDEDGDQTMFGINYRPTAFSVVTYLPESLNPNNLVIGDEWEPGRTITVRIDDPSNGAGWDYEDSLVAQDGQDGWANSQWTFWIDPGQFQIQPGFRVQVTDDDILKEHIVKTLAITNIDLDADTVQGTSNSTDIGSIWADRDDIYAMRQIHVDGSNWLVSFSQPGLGRDEQTVSDLKVTTLFIPEQWDEDGDSTKIWWNLPNPRIEARANDNRIEGYEWDLGSTVTIEIDDSDSAEDPEPVTATVTTTPWNENETWFEYNFNDYDLKPGDVITVSDENHIKQLVVSNFRITDVNLDTDIVSGKADPGQQVNIWTNWQEDPSTDREETADQDGNWSTNFAVPGDQDWEQGTSDLRAGSWVDSMVRDEDGDQTMFGWSVPNPSFSARLNDNEVHAYSWPLDAPVTLTVDDPTTPQDVDFTSTQTAIVADWDPNQTFVQFRLWEDDFTLEPGMTVTITDGTTTKTHVVTNFTVTNVDSNTETITGMGFADSRVDVWAWNETRYAVRHAMVQGGDVTGTVNAAQLAEQFIPSIMFGYKDALEDYDYNPVLARTLLTNAGYPNGFTVNLWLRDVPRVYLPHAIETAQAIQDYLSDVGITANIGVLDSGEMLNRTWNGEADLYLLGWGADFDHPDNFYYYHFCQQTTALGLNANNSICDQVMDARAETNAQAQVLLYEGISQKIHDDVPLAPLAHGRTSSLLRQDVNGFVPEWYGIGTTSFLNATFNGNELTYAIPSEPAGLDPAPAYDGAIYPVSSQVMETLVRTDSGVPAPGLAESWSVSSDGLTWTFTIRSAVTFHDGTPLNAEAVLYNLERWWDPDHPYHDGAFDYFGGIFMFNGFEGDPASLITDLTVVGGNQVQITLREPFSPILSALAAPSLAIASPTAIQARTLDTHPVGTGPFVFDEWSADGTIHLSANANYWDGALSLTNLNFKVIPDESARYAALLANTVQGMEVENVGYALMAQDDPNLQVVWHPEMNTGYLGINQAHGPLGNVLVRQAIAYAIDKQTLLAQNYNAITFGTGTWVADFANPGDEGDEQSTWDISGGDSGDAQQCDEDGDCTHRGWQAFNYTLHAVPTHPEVHGHEWPWGADVTLIIDDDTDPDNGVLYSRTKNADDDPWCGYPCFDLKDVFNLEVGQYVTMTDGEVTKTVHVSTLKIESVDIEHETLSGIADPHSDVMVNIWSQEGKARHTVADGNGNWSVDFSVLGDEDFEQFTTDISYGDNGRAIQLNLDGTDDGTLEYWDQDWVAPDMIPLVVATPSLPNLNHPEYTLEAWTVYNLLWEPLFRTTDQATLEPAAASSYSISPDGLTYTFTLRDDLRWSDGLPVTAQHYVDGLLRVLSPDNADYASLLYDIQGAEDFNTGVTSNSNDVGLRALNDHTLEITLAHPAVYFLKILADPGMIPARADLITQHGDAWTEPQNFVGNGPYTLAEYDGAHLLVQKNPQFHNAAIVALEQIAFDIIPDQNEQFETYQRGDVDVLMDAPDAALSDPNFDSERVYSAMPGVFFIGLNTQRAPTNNVLVRKALASAIDRRALLDDALHMPWLEEATGVVPPELFGYQGSDVGYEYNLAYAQGALAGAGYPGGVGLPTVHVYGFDNPRNRATLEAIAEGWRTGLNITVETHYLDYDSFNQWLGDCQNDPSACNYNALRQGWVIDYYDPHNILNDLFNPDSWQAQRLGWDNDRYHELIDLSRREMDPTQRLAYLNEAEQILVESDAAVIPLYFTERVSLVKPGFITSFGIIPNLYQWDVFVVSDIDSDGQPDLLDPCPGDATNTCDPAGSASGVITSDGGILLTEDNTVNINVPANAVNDNLTLNITESGNGYEVSTYEGTMSVIQSFSIEPHGTHFSEPVTITFHWDDADNDGIVDGTVMEESKLILIKDGLILTPSCAVNPNCNTTDNTLAVQVTDLSLFEFAVPVNDKPQITSITAPVDPVQIGGSVTVTVAFNDPDVDDTHSVKWSWEDGTTTTLPAAAKIISAAHTYAAPGVYTVTVTVEDAAGEKDTKQYRYIVLYDPIGGFVTGGGWFINPTSGEKANFGFNPKYQKDGVTLKGETEFRLNGLNFKSTSHEWMVINGWKASFTGTGTINGAGMYIIEMVMIDGQIAGGGGADKLRVMIWNDMTDDLVYDSELGTAEFANPNVSIGGGSIVIHKAK